VNIYLNNFIEGLKYEDLLVEHKDVAVALTRIDPQTLLDRYGCFVLVRCHHLNRSVLRRERRIKRAFDLSAKKKYLPEELQIDDPFDVIL
jgi:hypothetical protein